MGLLIALIPAFGWGIQPLILKKIGGTPVNSMLGFGIGSTIVGLCVQMLYSPAGLNSSAFLLSFISGMFWVIGQAGQVSSYDIIGVSKTMPISTGLQLLGTSIISMLAFGEWASLSSKIFGFLAIALLIFGAYLTSFEEEIKEKANRHLIKGVQILLWTSFGYWFYSAVPKMVNAQGLSMFLPQMLGVLVGSIIYAFFKERQAFWAKESWQSVGVGLIFGIASLAYIFSAKLNGVTLAFILTQLNVIISTLGGIYILKEGKSKREFRLTYLGLLIIVAASIMTIFL
ncbi:GRP family sugar transporter [Streptococcus sp. zg-JUN1979]|uniref:GRP family sugar transporter n=1 Tax=Streptococcus sp. zg-JUN1979 TaxID=3391450 RepID=UPI0039A71335